jgi:peptidoglycan/LPS O-acetylase OafA/YrhL
VPSFLLSLYFSFTDGAYAYYFPLSRFWELGIGASLNYLPVAFTNKGKFFPSPQFLSFFAFFGLVLSFFIIDGSSVFPGWLALIPVLSVALIIVVGQQATVVRCLLTHRTLVWLGLISYPLYLIHWPLFSFWKIITLETPGNFVTCLILLVSLAMASLIYIRLELPIRRKGGWKTTSSLLVFMLILGMLGLNVFKRDGYPFRPIAEATLLSNINEFAEELPNALCSQQLLFS